VVASLRTAAALVLLLLAVVFALASFWPILRYRSGYLARRRGIIWASVFLEVAAISMMVWGYLIDPDKGASWICVVLLFTPFVGIFLVVHLFYLRMWQRWANRARRKDP
jgi:hypothetical protein